MNIYLCETCKTFSFDDTKFHTPEHLGHKVLGIAGEPDDDADSLERLAVRHFEIASLLKDQEFDPDWCIHPGVTFNACLNERGIKFVPSGKLDPIYEVWELRPRAEIDYHRADLIVELLGEPQTSPGFWVRLSNNYQEGLRAGKKDTTPR